jgi:hypothetical protein
VLLRIVADRSGIRARLLPPPFALWEALALLSEFAPGTSLTRGQVALMRRDNVASQDLPDLHDLRITPTALDDVLTAADVGRRQHGADETVAQAPRRSAAQQRKLILIGARAE